MKKLIIAILTVLLLSGCDYKELNDLAIVSAVSIDKVDEGYKLVVQVVNPMKQQDVASSDEPDFIIYESIADNLQEAFRTLVFESPRKVYGAQIQILLLSEELVRDDMEAVVDFLFREPEIRKEFYMLIEQEGSEDILSILTSLTNLSATNIQDSLKADNQYLGISNLVTFNEMMNNYLDDKLEIVLPSVYMEGNEDAGKKEGNLEETQTEATVKLGTLGVFKDNKFVGYLTFEESLAYNFIMDQVTKTLIKYECDTDKYVVSEIISTETKTSIEPSDNKVKIEITGQGSINDSMCEYQLENSKVIEKINEEINTEIERMIKDSIASINEKYQSDIYGFEDMYYKSDYKKYKKVKDDFYEKVFSKLEYEVKADVVLFEKGNTMGGTNDKKQD